MNRTGEIRLHDTTIGVWEEHVDDTMREALLFVCEHLSVHGWDIGPDLEIAERYPILAKNHFAGTKHKLRVAIRLQGRHLEIIFAQQSEPGSYLLTKLAQLPPELRLRCIAETSAVIKALAATGYQLMDQDGFRNRRVEPTLRNIRNLAEERRGGPLETFNRAWGTDRFKRDESGWPHPSELDSYSRTFTQGSWKYGRDSSGRLVYGQTFGGINGMWKLISNESTVSWYGSTFFDCDRPDLEPRRLVPGQVERLRKELDKALKGNNYRRVAVLAKVLERVASVELKGAA